jgi:hypothetical protein
MSEMHLEEMGLDVERVVAAVDFLSGYAEFAVAELEPDDAFEAMSSEESRWTSMTDAATAFREAAQWALFLDPFRARALLDRSGDLFHTLGQPFGAYLKVLSGSWFYDPPYAEFAQQLEDLARLTRPTDAELEAPIPVPLSHPQQQAYLMLAATASPSVGDEFHLLLQEMADESPHRWGVVPVGALGAPIRWFWHVAKLLLEPSRSTASEVAAQLGALTRRYTESIELASANEYCWRNAAAPVDVGDIDIIGIAVIASRRFGFEELFNALGDRLEIGPYPERAVLEVALEYSRAEG